VISGLSGNLTIVFMVWASPHFTALFYTGNSPNRKTGSLARVTAPKTIRLASSKLALYGNSEELGPVAVTVIAGLHQGINRVHGLGFDRNDKADGLAELAGIFAHKCGSLVGGVAAQDCETKRGLITRMTLSDASLTIHRTV
jgi:hypothetical protein